jgi:arachidonate 15-lipoxygenase
MTAFIPQCDPDQVSRRTAIDQAQKTYQFNYTHVSPLALVDKLPPEPLICNWKIKLAEFTLTAMKNLFNNAQEKSIRGAFWSRIREVELVANAAKGMVAEDLEVLLGVFLHHHAEQSVHANPVDSLEEYAKLFNAIGLPPVSARIGNDIHFAHMRLAGPNPLMLHRIPRVDESRFSFKEADFQRLPQFKGDSLAAAGAEGRLFFVDYEVLSHITAGQLKTADLQKFLYAPMALFVVDKTTCELMPVAIQCERSSKNGDPIFTPDDGHNWMIAKTIVEIADGNVHEAISHLGRTHLLIEPFVISTFRQLAPNHPIFLLLTPHFEGTLRINSMAWKYLIKDGGPVDRLLGGTIQESRGLAATGLRSQGVKDSYLPLCLKNRGVDDKTWLKYYPYRDDAELYWNAIKEWVQSYVKIYYPSDEQVGNDPELLAWIHEVGAEDGGRIPGFEFAPSPTIASLAEALTFIIFTASVQHAAVNFPQYSLMSYVPNMPLAGFSRAPRTKEGGTERDYLNHLPPLPTAELQLYVGYVLGSMHYTTLGHYPENYFRDPLVAGPLKTFQDSLDEAGKQIAIRNSTRSVPYRFLERSGIPQSINI